jgi:hypothetical protein
MDIKMNFHENLGLNDSAIKSGLGTKIESVGMKWSNTSGHIIKRQ